MTNTENQPANLSDYLMMLEMLPPTRRVDFQASVLAGAAAAIDPETWTTILTKAAQHAHRDPWA